MSKIMNSSKRYLLPFIVIAIAASLGSCSSNPTPRNIASVSPTPTITPITPSPILSSSPSPTPTPSKAPIRTSLSNVEPVATTPATPAATTQAAASKTVNVTLYASDAQCQELIPQKVSVPAEEPVKGAVDKIIKQQETGDFGFTGYRVNVKNGVATVDLRLSPQSKRQLTSLSSCEQFALFGSLRKTLTSNAQWNIKEVRFTERGQEIVL
ncbi:GerMN domain-containing protein [Nostocaceae cyanobacterium CENA369]|uniref:GerMN domain-containing protein n=2 Tax=Dendronalium TaxID=2840442 RepID=A0A8J7I614_9NOST|nr:GerMN domain-containing protein [Dendronalium phyllosphericum CENA369]